MTLFKKNQKEFTIHPFIEFLVVTVSLIAILVPLRIFSKTVFENEWLGSLGMISIVLGMLLFLSKKQKLGMFGRMFLRQISKNHKGKKKTIIYFQTALFLSIGIFTIFGIHTGNTEYKELKDQVIEKFLSQGVTINSDLNYESIKQISSQVSVEQQIESITYFPILMMENFGIFSVVLAVTDQLMGGWAMYFWQVMVIEITEITIFVIITKKLFLKNS